MEDIARALTHALRDSKRSWGKRVARRLGRSALRLSWWLTKKGVKHFTLANVRWWVPLAPFQAASLMWAVSALCHTIPGAWRTLAVVLALGAVAPYWFCGLPFPMARTTRTGFVAETVQAMTRTPRLTRRSIAWTFSGYGLAALLAVIGAIIGPGVRHGDPIPGLWLVWSFTFGWPWWWAWHAIRKPAAEARAISAGIDDRLAAWAEFGLANTEVFNPSDISRVIPGELVPAASDRVELAEPQPTVIGWQIQGVVSRGKGGASKLIGMTEDVAALYETDVENVAIEPARGNARKFTVSVFTHNPLRQTTLFPGPQVFDPLTGVASIGVYADCAECLYRFYKRGSGPVHDLIAGTTDAGKSRLVEMLLSIERATPFMASAVIDPQRGQSLPAFKSMRSGAHRTGGFATTAEEGLLLLMLLREEMYARNEHLAGVAWTDVDAETGEEFDEEGVDSFDPLEGPTAGMKLIVLTIDEAHMILSNPIAVAMVEDIAKMARKCGIKLRLITQVPLLDQLGGSTTLRDMVAAGNVVVLRTANSLSGQVAFNGSLPVDPKTLPREWEVDGPDGQIIRIQTQGLGYVLGPGARPVPMRTYFQTTSAVRKAARSGDTAEIELTTYAAQGWTLNDFLTVFRSQLADCRPTGIEGEVEISKRINDLLLEYLPGQPAGKGAPRAVASGPSKLLPQTTERSGNWEAVRDFLAAREADGTFGASKELIRQGTGLERQNVDTVLRRRKGGNGKPAEIHEVRPGFWALGPAPAKPAEKGTADPMRIFAEAVLSGAIGADDKTVEACRLAMEAEERDVVAAAEAELKRRTA